MRNRLFTAPSTFGYDPMLGGVIDKFGSRSGSGHVNPDWSVELQEQAFSGAVLFDGVTVATGRDGVWEAQGYGDRRKRPAGIYGGFNAHFSDGHAAGAYATRKQ